MVNLSSVFLPKVSTKAYVFAFSGTSIEAHWVAEVDHHDVRLTEGAIIHGTKARAPTENMAVRMHRAVRRSLQ